MLLLLLLLLLTDKAPMQAQSWMTRVYCSGINIPRFIIDCFARQDKSKATDKSVSSSELH